MVDNGLVGKSHGLGKKDYNGILGIFNAWFPGRTIKCGFVIDDFVVILAEKTFKGYSEEHSMLKLNELISLSEGKAIYGRISIDWTKTFEAIKKLHRKKRLFRLR